LDEFKSSNIDYYVNFGGELDELEWRKLSPQIMFERIDSILKHRLA